MRISDWSSDVCSSDLGRCIYVPAQQVLRGDFDAGYSPVIAILISTFEPCLKQRSVRFAALSSSGTTLKTFLNNLWNDESGAEIGSASGRERGCQYVEMSVVAVALKKQRKKKNK